eukprot:5057748-Prymnesium_polylepis.1
MPSSRRMVASARSTPSYLPSLPTARAGCTWMRVFATSSGEQSTVAQKPAPVPASALHRNSLELDSSGMPAVIASRARQAESRCLRRCRHRRHVALPIVAP